MELQATFEVVDWDEKPVEEWDGGTLTRAVVRKRYSGDIEGDAEACERPEGRCPAADAARTAYGEGWPGEHGAT